MLDFIIYMWLIFGCHAYTFDREEIQIAETNYKYNRKNDCESEEDWKMMSKEECFTYATKNQLTAHDPFSDSWISGCKGCVSDGDEVAFNTHENAACSNDWKTVCKQEVELVKDVYASDGKLCVDLADDDLNYNEDGWKFVFQSMEIIRMTNCYEDLTRVKRVIRSYSGEKVSGCYSIPDLDQRLLVHVTFETGYIETDHQHGTTKKMYNIYDQKYYVPSGSKWCDVCPSGYKATFGSSNMLGECQQHQTNQGESGIGGVFSIEACKAECDADYTCVAFDWKKNVCYKNSFCDKQDSDSFFSCMKEDYSDVLTRYEHLYQGCVSGANIVLEKDQTIEECADLCDQNSDCLAFEYGVDHDGVHGHYEKKDCQLQSSYDPDEICDGQDWNLDLYVKKADCVLPSSKYGYSFSGSSLSNCNSVVCDSPTLVGVSCDSSFGYHGMPQISGCTRSDPTATMTGCERESDYFLTGDQASLIHGRRLSSGLRRLVKAIA